MATLPTSRPATEHIPATLPRLPAMEHHPATLHSLPAMQHLPVILNRLLAMVPPLPTLPSRHMDPTLRMDSLLTPLHQHPTSSHLLPTLPSHHHHLLPTLPS